MLSVFALAGIPRVKEHDDIAALIAEAASRTQKTSLRDGDIMAISSKIVSKSEGRTVNAEDREQAITNETVRVVATRQHPGGITRIVENHLGIVGAAAGIDASNTPEGTILLLPLDPDRSAQKIREDLETRLGLRLGIIITDTLGRPWREGQTDVAIGGSGVRLVDDLRGTLDVYGRTLEATTRAVGDEIASAAELLKGKSSGLPVVVLRGLPHLLDRSAAGGRSLIRSPENDMFRMGSREAWQQGFEAGQGHVYSQRK